MFEGRAMTLAELAGKSGVRRFCVDLPIGLTVLTLCLLAGEELRVWLRLIIPGNLLGLFVLLLCFHLRVIPVQLIEEAANRVLYVMPALFIPLFVSAISQDQLWSRLGWVLLPALLIATAALWIFVGHLAQRLWQEAKSLIPKSVTTAVAVGIAEEASSGRPPHEQLMEPLLAIGIMISPLSGAVLGPLVLRIAGVRDHRAVGLALGCTSIGMGVARAFEIDATAGAFASVGMSLTAVCAGFILPWLLRLI
ncbi:MAG: LrgB family protein [Chthoniobacterales bacterium]